MIKPNHIPDLNALPVTTSPRNKEIVPPSVECGIHGTALAELDCVVVFPYQRAGAEDANPVEREAEEGGRVGFSQY